MNLLISDDEENKVESTEKEDGSLPESTSGGKLKGTCLLQIIFL